MCIAVLAVLQITPLYILCAAAHLSTRYYGTILHILSGPPRWMGMLGGASCPVVANRP